MRYKIQQKVANYWRAKNLTTPFILKIVDFCC